MYLDDNVIFMQKVNSDIAHLRQVMTLLRDTGDTFTSKECLLFAEKTNYLGHVIRPGRLETSEVTTAAVCELKHSTTETELRSFSGLCSVFHRFVPNVSKVEIPLNKKLRKDQPSLFLFRTVAEEDVGENVWKLLTNPSIIAIPRAMSQYKVGTVACDSQLGCVVKYKQEDDTSRLTGYWSTTLTNAE